MSFDRASQSKKNLTAIFKRFQQVGQNTVAKELSVSDGFISGWKNKDAEQAANILAALGLKVVPVDMDCYHPKTIAAVFHLAGERLQQLNEQPEQIAQELKWEATE